MNYNSIYHLILKKKRLVAETSITLLVLSSWIFLIILAVQNQFNVPSVEGKNFAQWVNEHQPIIIDLREKNEIDKKPIPYEPIIHMPFLFIESRLEHVTIPQDYQVLFVCSDGNRARLIASLLTNKGIDVYYLKSGLYDVDF